MRADVRPRSRAGKGVVQLENDAKVVAVDVSSIVVEGAVYSYALPE